MIKLASLFGPGHLRFQIPGCKSLTSSDVDCVGDRGLLPTHTHTHTESLLIAENKGTKEGRRNLLETKRNKQKFHFRWKILLKEAQGETAGCLGKRQKLLQKFPTSVETETGGPDC